MAAQLPLQHGDARKYSLQPDQLWWHYSCLAKSMGILQVLSFHVNVIVAGGPPLFIEASQFNQHPRKVGSLFQSVCQKTPVHQRDHFHVPTPSFPRRFPRLRHLLGELRFRLGFRLADGLADAEEPAGRQAAKVLPGHRSMAQASEKSMGQLLECMYIYNSSINS